MQSLWMKAAMIYWWKGWWCCQPYLSRLSCDNYCGVGVVRTPLDKLRQTAKIFCDVYFLWFNVWGAGLVCKSLVLAWKDPSTILHPWVPTGCLLTAPSARRSPHQLCVPLEASAAAVGWCLPACLHQHSPLLWENILEDTQYCCTWTLVR